MRRIATLVAVILAATVVPAILTPHAAQAAKPNGAVQVADINPGNNSSVPQYLTRFGDIALFQAFDDAHGLELWQTDGTAAGTSLVKDINSGPTGSNPQAFTVFGDIVIFLAFDDAAGAELWKTDGTAAGTVRVKDINPGTDNAFSFGSIDPELTVFGPMVLFKASNSEGLELWRTDGSEAGTTLIDASPGINSLLPSGLTVFGGVVLFSGDSADGPELWKTDGTLAGTAQVKDINPGGGPSSVSEITPFGSIALFRANNGTTGRELFKTDGTAAGTQLVKDIDLSSESEPTGFTLFGSSVLFAAATSSNGSELWTTDGTATGTVMVKDIDTTPNQGSGPRDFAVLGGKVLFFASEPADGWEPWVTDGTAAGTTKVKDVCSSGGSQLSPFTVFGNVALFNADDCTVGAELWASNGTSGGTYRVAEINQVDNIGGYPTSIIDFGTMALFAADDGVDGVELYRTVVRRVPGAPTIGTATAGNAQAMVTFTPPASNGGSAITGYTVTSTPGGVTKTGTGSPITVTGLTNGVSYRFSLHATNAVGNSPESALSNAVTPTASTAKSITVVQPNGGESIKRGLAYTIKWNYTGSPGTTVRIVLLKAGTGVQTIASSQAIGTGGAGQRSWTPPTSLAAASSYKIKIVVNGTSPVIQDLSNATFSLT